MPDIWKATSSMSSPTGLRERKKRATRRDLVAAGEKLFTENEFDDVTVDQVAELANVSQKTFFNYFPSKSQLLKELLLDWLKDSQLWPEEVEPDLTLRSAITPANIEEILDWIVRHRRLMKMALRHTDFFDFIYLLDREDVEDEYHLFAAIRRPRIMRLERAQELRLVRNDVSARHICNLYDSLRLDIVRRWLYLPDEQATAEGLRSAYYEAVEVLLRGISHAAERPAAATESAAAGSVAG